MEWNSFRAPGLPQDALEGNAEDLRSEAGKRRRKRCSSHRRRPGRLARADQGSAKDECPKKGRERTDGGGSCRAWLARGWCGKRVQDRTEAWKSLPQGSGRTSGGEDHDRRSGTAVSGRPSGRKRTAGRRRQSRVEATWGRKVAGAEIRGRARETGQPIGTDATPERAREDRDEGEFRFSERHSRTERTPAEPVSAQWGSAAMPGPISRLGPDCPFELLSSGSPPVALSSLVTRALTA